VNIQLPTTIPLIDGLFRAPDPVTSDDYSYSYPSSDASSVLGYHGKELGRDETTLAAYLDLART